MGDLNKIKSEILYILSDEAASSQTIIKKIDCPKSKIYRALKELRDEKRIIQLPNLNDTRKYFYMKVI